MLWKIKISFYCSLKQLIEHVQYPHYLMYKFNSQKYVLPFKTKFSLKKISTHLVPNTFSDTGTVNYFNINQSFCFETVFKQGNYGRGNRLCTTYVSCRFSLTDFATFVDEDGCVLTGWLIRNYCEKVKRSKHIIDGFPNTKQVAMWLLEK